MMFPPMFPGFVRASGSCAALMLALTLPVWAQPPSPEPAVLWYRSTQGCPDGADFLQRIGDRAPLVRLAEAGDRVDFMVTVAVTPEGASGRLERETDRGTVAIREFEAASCDRVAEVLALNLALALDPDRSPPEPYPVALQDTLYVCGCSMYFFGECIFCH